MKFKCKKLKRLRIKKTVKLQQNINLILSHKQPQDLKQNKIQTLEVLYQVQFPSKQPSNSRIKLLQEQICRIFILKQILKSIMFPVIIYKTIQ